MDDVYIEIVQKEVGNGSAKLMPGKPTNMKYIKVDVFHEVHTQR